jgi:hypothetical protein
MAAPRALTFVLAGFLVTGCSGVLPKPEYSYVKTPPPIRTLPDGTRVDNRGYHMDANGNRLDRNGQILGMVDYDTKASDSGSSNAVAGYYISSKGTVASGTVAVPSVGGRAGVPDNGEYAPISSSTSNVPRGSENSNSTVAAPVPEATTTPIPLAPPATR